MFVDFMHRRKLLYKPEARKGDIDPALLYYCVEPFNRVMRFDAVFSRGQYIGRQWRIEYRLQAMNNTSAGSGVSNTDYWLWTIHREAVAYRIPTTGYELPVPGACLRATAATKSIYRLCKPIMCQWWRNSTCLPHIWL